MSEPNASADESPAEPAAESWIPGREAVIDLLGLLALGELFAFDRMAIDARLAPDLGRRAQLAGLASREIANYRLLADRIVEHGADPTSAMAPFTAAIGSYHEKTAPRDWLEALVKVYVGDAVADDFFRAVAPRLEPEDRELVERVISAGEAGDYAAAEIRAAIAADDSVASRLSLWGRRLVGEGLSRAQAVAASRENLAGIIAGGGDPLAAVEDLLRQLNRAHQDRMKAVGLNN